MITYSTPVMRSSDAEASLVTLAGEMSAVTLTVVHDEMEADVVCGLLQANDIECFHRKTDVAGAWTTGFARGGPIEVLVDERDLAAARALLTPAQ